jgi:hypothetical protein
VIVRDYTLLHFHLLAALTHADSWGSIPLPFLIITHGLVLPKERYHAQGGRVFVPEHPFSPSHTAKPVDFGQFDILGPEIAATAVLSNCLLIHVTVPFVRVLQLAGQWSTSHTAAGKIETQDPVGWVM